MIRQRLAASALLFSLLSSGCGSGQPPLHLFATDWEDDHGYSVLRLQKALGNVEIPLGADVVVGVSGNADGVVAYDLAHDTKWSFSHPLDARPAIAGHVVILSGGQEIVALEAESGKKLWSRPTGGLNLLGAGDDGSVTAVAFAQRGGRGSTLLAVLRDGTVVRQIETSNRIGVPAVVHGYAFVPWAEQYVSVIDLANGDEAARVVLREKVTRAWTSSGQLLFGERAFVRWDEKVHDASKGGANRVGLPERVLPGTPLLMDPGDERLAPVATARDSVRLFARAAGDVAPALALDAASYYSTYFKVVLGLDAKDGRIRWAHTHSGGDLLGGSAVPGGFIGCDDTGKVFALRGRDGAITASHDLAEPLRACVVQSDSFRADREGEASKGLAEQLTEVIRSDDLRLAAEQRVLLKELTQLTEDSATKTLIEVADDPRASPDLVADARAALAKRRTGASFMKGALARHYDYLHDVLREPPVGPLADALRGIGDSGAAPLLAKHLLDPAEASDDVKRAAQALSKIGTAAELAPLRQFFAMNRGIDDDEDLTAACVAAGLAIARIDPTATGRGVIDQAIADPMTSAPLREKLAAAIEKRDRALAAKAEADAGGAPAKPADAGHTK